MWKPRTRLFIQLPLRNKLFSKIQMIIVLWIHVLCVNAPCKHQDQNISLKLFKNEHDSVKDAWKKGQKTSSTRKIGPAKKRKEGQEKRKKRGREKAKSKSQHCCVVTLFCKNGENIFFFFHYLLKQLREAVSYSVQKEFSFCVVGFQQNSIRLRLSRNFLPRNS